MAEYLDFDEIRRLLWLECGKLNTIVPDNLA